MMRYQTDMSGALSYSRKNRGPVHNFHLRHRPYVIQPFMIAPVLPAETFKNALMQSRVVTDPIVNPLIGWWMEYHWFYVKHRDLAGRDDFVNMMLQPGFDLSAYNAAANINTYHPGPGVDWTKLCLDRVVQTWFRDDEDLTAHTVTQGATTMPIAQIAGNSWLDSVIDTTVLDDGVGDPGATTNPEALDLMMQQWELMRQMQMTDMSYEDWLATYGVRKEKAELHQPERIRSIKQWSYPSNTIDPADGSPSSAVSWSIAERADKDRFFREPGFILGVTLARPKVYLENQKGAGVSMMNGAMNWLPALMADQPHTSLKEYLGGGSGNGPLGIVPTNGYWVDIRDLLIYGDQFVNFALTASDAGLVALPTAAMEKRYVPTADIDALFVDAAGGKNLVRQDGVCSLTIAGAQTDHTGGRGAGMFIGAN